jgi:hypothetical protein
VKKNVIIGMRAINDPGWFPFHKGLAQDMRVVVISVVFAVVAPMCFCHVRSFAFSVEGFGLIIIFTCVKVCLNQVGYSGPKF